MSHLPVTDVKKVKKKEKCKPLTLYHKDQLFHPHRTSYHLQVMISKTFLCVYGFFNLLSTDYSSFVTKICNSPVLFRRVLANTDFALFFQKA